MPCKAIAMKLFLSRLYIVMVNLRCLKLNYCVCLTFYLSPNIFKWFDQPC